MTLISFFSKNMRIIILISIWTSLINNVLSQQQSLVNTSQSPYAKLSGINMSDVKWTKGFWAERFATCRDSMVPSMWRLFNNPDIAHSFRNFEIAAGLQQGKHEGPPFHDGDFYKWLEGMTMVYVQTKDPKLDQLMDKIIAVIAKAQREDGYIHTPVLIEERNSGKKTEFQDRLNFETYNLGHLMTAGGVHYRATGKRTLLNVAIKATDYLYNFYKRSSPELARNAICPSHYMGVIEMYRTTRDPKYLELAKNLINIRGMVENGTDDNQDRVPFRQQTKAMGHAVRANYLYAGVADVYSETGDTSLIRCLNLIWDDMVHRKMYITGACGSLYDGTSPDGTSYQPNEVQKVHQAYGRDYQLPNHTAHNESCANIGNVLWNWRMLQVTGDAKYADIMEQALYNSILSAVDLSGTKYFYTNPLAVSKDLPYTLRWSKDREEYISFCNCCPPNTVRTIAEVSNYAYSLSKKGIYCNIYGGNAVSTTLQDGSALKLTQETEYPWNGKIVITLEKVPVNPFSVFLRIPGWCHNATININGKAINDLPVSGNYIEINRKWTKNDLIELNLPMPVRLIESNPLVEETRNQVAIMRGPVVYCLESPDIQNGKSIFDLGVSMLSNFKPVKTMINKNEIIVLEGNAEVINTSNWNNKLYQELSAIRDTLPIKLIPYFAWNNRGKSEMTVWMPLNR
jgi:uncharacterized protein